MYGFERIKTKKYNYIYINRNFRKNEEKNLIRIEN